MLGPFSIDTYLPAFTGIGQAIGASPVEMQQTLSAYLFGFAVMNLFHGALSDSLGRRPIVLGGLVVFTLASVGASSPVFWSMRKTMTFPPDWLATSMYFPVGSMAKFRA